MANRSRSFSRSTPTISPGPTTTFLSRIAWRTTAPRPTRVKSLLRVRHLKNELERALSYLNEIDQDETIDTPMDTQ